MPMFLGESIKHGQRILTRDWFLLCNRKIVNSLQRVGEKERYLVG
jgi:hypothetical protein